MPLKLVSIMSNTLRSTVVLALFLGVFLLVPALDVAAFVPHPALGTRRITAVSTAGVQSDTEETAAVTIIYGHPGTRSPLVNWACEELGIPYEMGDLRQNPHPFGQLPCLQEGNAVLFESGAILQYLSQKYANDLNHEESASVTSWITWANASLDPICFLETPDGKVYDTGIGKPNKRIARLDELLANDEYLVGKRFTLADVAVASYLLYVMQFFPNTKIPYKHVKAYMKRCASRPAYGEAFGVEVQERVVQLLDNKLFGVF